MLGSAALPRSGATRRRATDGDERAGCAHAAGDASRRTADAHADSDAAAPPPYAFGWRQSIGNGGPLTLVVTDGLLLVSGGTPPLVARSLDTGEARWNASLVAGGHARDGRSSALRAVERTAQRARRDDGRDQVAGRAARARVGAALARGLAHRRRRSRAARLPRRRWHAALDAAASRGRHQRAGHRRRFPVRDAWPTDRSSPSTSSSRP